MKPGIVFAAAIVPLCCACAEEPDSAASQSRAPAVEVLGEPVDCVLVSRIQNTVVHDDFTIDFRLTGGDVLRNTLPTRCPRLGFEQRIAYEVHGGQLCRREMISVIQPGAAGPGPRCQLGAFVPVRVVGSAAGS
jgi:hypothetical protein